MTNPALKPSSVPPPPQIHCILLSAHPSTQPICPLMVEQYRSVHFAQGVGGHSEHLLGSQQC